MLSLDLFDSRYEKRLHEGALDDTITRTQAHLMEPLSRRAADIRTQIRTGKLSGAELDKLEKEYEDLVQKRLDIMLDRQPKNEQQVPSRQDPFAYVKPEPKGIGDIQDPKQKMAQLQQQSKKGALANVASGIKAFVKGEPEPMGEQTQPRTHAQNVYFEILKAWEDERDYIVIPFPNAPNPVTMIRGQIWNAIVDLGLIKDPKRRAKYVEERFNDFESFMSWLGNLKRYKVPAKKKGKTQSLPLQIPQQPTGQAQPTAPGSPLMDPEFTGIKPPGNLQEKKKSRDLDAKDVGLSRELQKARARFPAAASDLEAGILDQMDQQQQAQQALAQQQADLNRQDQQIAGLAQVNQQQDGVMRAQGQEIDRLTQRLQQVMAQPTAAPATAPVTPQVEPAAPDAAPAPDMVYVPDVPADTATQDREIARLDKQIQQLELMMALKTPAERSDLEDRIRDLEKARGEQEEKKRATAKKSAATRQRKKQATTIDMEPAQAQLGFGASGDYLDPSAVLVKNRPEPEQGAEVKSAKAKARAAIAKARTKQTSEPQGVSETVENVRAGMAKIYRRLAPKIERHRDSFLAGQLYDELENYAELHGAEDEFKRMMATARNSAHMEYDTNPGGFQNWFWFLPFEDEQLEEGLRPGEYHIHTVYFKDGTKKRIRVTSDEVDVADYYTKRGKAVDRVDYDFQLHSNMTEQFAMPGTTIPRKSVIQGYTVFFNPKTRLVSITRGGDSEEAAIEQARIGTPSIKNFRLAADRLITKIESDLNEAKEIVTKNDFLDRRDYLLRMISADSNPANKQIIRAEIRKLESQAEAEGWITMQQRMVREDSDSGEAVEMAIMRRMLVAHTDLIIEFGLDKVVDAIEEVAYNVGDVDEIGSSDVSGWVRQVKQILGAEA